MEDNSNIIHVKFDKDFYYHKAMEKMREQDFAYAGSLFEKALERSPDDFVIIPPYAECLVELNNNIKAEELMFDQIVKDNFVTDYYFYLSQMYMKTNEPNKAFLFGLRYVTEEDDQDYFDEMIQMFEVKYSDQTVVEEEAERFVVQHIFQYLFGNGRLHEANEYLEKQPKALQEDRHIMNLKAMALLYNSNYEEAESLLQTILEDNSSDIYALCHMTLLLYNTEQKDRFNQYLKQLSKLHPINDEESFKLGVVLSYLGKHKASNELLVPLLKKMQSSAPQLHHALSYNFYNLGYEDEARHHWRKFNDYVQSHNQLPPWKIDELKSIIDSQVLPLLKDEDYRYRLYGIFLLSHMKNRELVMSYEVWDVLENLPDYERLYITYTFQNLHLEKLGFIDKGMKLIEQSEYQQYGKELFVSWIEHAEMIIADDKSIELADHYVAASVYIYLKTLNKKVTKKEIQNSFNVSTYRLNKAIKEIVSI
nr:tetratricopeptide repeat protein [Mammaliicoccus sp. Marseille-Q6498]